MTRSSTQVDETILEMIHDSHNNDFSQRLSNFIADSHVSNGTACQALAEIIAKSLAHTSDSEELGCLMAQHYGVYIHRIFHYACEYLEETRKTKLHPNVVPLKKKT